MTRTYIAFDIEILNLSWKPDSSNTIIPPEAIIEFPKKMNIMYGDEDIEMIAGTALLFRKDNSIVANMTLKSSYDNQNDTQRLLAKLYPATGFYVLEAKNNTIYKLKIFELFLSPYKNDDKDINFLGDRVRLRIPKKGSKLMKTPDYILQDDVSIGPMGDTKTIAKGSFVRPIEFRYVPKETKDFYYYYYLSSRDIYCYTSMGIVPIPEKLIRQVS